MILRNLTAEPEHGDIDARSGTRTAVHFEAAPGLFLHVKLGAAGLTVSREAQSVGIPLEDLVRVAVAHLPSLVPSVAQPAPEPNA